MRPLKRYFNALIHQKLLPKLNMLVGCILNRSSTFACGVHLGWKTRVFNSTLGRNVFIGNNNRLNRVRVEDNVSISRDTTLKNAEVGAYSYISYGGHLGHTTIGRFCSIGPYLICGFGQHPVDFVSTSPVFYSSRKQCGLTFANADYFKETAETSIGNDVWIGARVFIKDGVSIGNGAIVAAGAVVTKNVPDYAIVAGVPAKIIRFRFPLETIRQLNHIAWWNWEPTRLQAGQMMFAQTDIRRFINWARAERLQEEG